jgi:hypothetical protein
MVVILLYVPIGGIWPVGLVTWRSCKGYFSGSAVLNLGDKTIMNKYVIIWLVIHCNHYLQQLSALEKNVNE